MGSEGGAPAEPSDNPVVVAGIQIFPKAGGGAVTASQCRVAQAGFGEVLPGASCADNAQVVEQLVSVDEGRLLRFR